MSPDFWLGLATGIVGTIVGLCAGALIGGAITARRYLNDLHMRMTDKWRREHEYQSGKR